MDVLLVEKLYAIVRGSAAVEWLVVFLGVYFPYLVAAGLAVCAFLGKTALERRAHRLLAAGTIASAVLARLALTELVRFFIPRPRPFVSLHLTPLIAHENSASFPSGHAAFFFGIAFFVMLRRPRLSIAFFAAALLISAARIAAGIHYPTDILGGAAAGLIAAFLVEKILRWRERQRESAM